VCDRAPTTYLVSSTAFIGAGAGVGTNPTADRICSQEKESVTYLWSDARPLQAMVFAGKAGPDTLAKLLERADDVEHGMGNRFVCELIWC
jgi:hypothetical protein